jgi:hypothetical protein
MTTSDMASAADMASTARTYLRDFPIYFEIDEGPLNVLTIRLPHPLVQTASLQVYITDTSATPPTTMLTDQWELDGRNGLLKVTDETALGKVVLVSGYHHTWFSDEELTFHLSKVIHEMTYQGQSLDDFVPVQMDIIALGGVVHALWSLSMELALDIDVSTPEGMFIPARQRYSQVVAMAQGFEREYQDKAAMLNMGLNSFDQSRLRRVAKMTGRFVPVYIDREFDDPRPPERVYPPIPEGIVTGSTDLETIDVLYGGS